MAKRLFNGSPTVDGYYTTFDSSEVHRVGNSDDQGGGGSSDFSTARVTIVNNTDSHQSITFMPYHISNHELTEYVSAVRITDEYGASQDNFNDPFGVNGGESINIDVCVVSGKNFSGVVNHEDVTVTLAGQAEESYMVAPDESHLPVILITGDCTITISDDGVRVEE